MGLDGPLWAQLNQGMPPNYTRGIALCFDAGGSFVGCRQWRRHEEVVYRSGPPGGHDDTPCSKFGGESVKTAARLGKAAGYFADRTDDPWWGVVYEALGRGKKDAIDPGLLQQIDTALTESRSDADNRPYLFIARLDGEDLSPCWRWGVVREAVEQRFFQQIATVSGRPCSGEGTCYICGQRATVYGNLSVLACYNLDKRGAIAGGFQTSGAARNFPVCGACGVRVSAAADRAQADLRGYAAGISYLALPATRNRELRGYLRSELEAGHIRLALSSGRDPLDGRERDLLSVAADLAAEGNAADLAFRFIFFRSSNADWRILAEVQHVLPSRLGALYALAVELAADPLLATAKGEGIWVDARLLGQFTASAGKRGQQVLRTWLAALLEDRAVDRRAFVHAVTTALLTRHRKDPSFADHASRQAWALLRYALAAGLINKEPPVPLELPASPYGDYCADHPDFFTTRDRVAAFLTGCFVSIVCYVQKKERGAEPFAKKFRGRLVNPRLLQRLYREGRDRLEIYGGMGLARELDADLAEVFVDIGQNWTSDDDTLTLAFTIGYSLQYRIAGRAARAAKET